MSVVPDAIIARRLGLRILAVSMVTSTAAGTNEAAPDHEHTMRVAAASAQSLTRVLVKFLEIWVLDSPRG
jgi:purine-nucleoside phosphorylase